MKKIYTILAAAMLSIVMVSTATAAKEEKVEVKAEKADAKAAANEAKGGEYRRSSLCLMMIKTPTMPMAEMIEKSFLESPMPEKYNDHNVGKRVFALSDVKVEKEDNAVFQEAISRGKSSESKAANPDDGEAGEKKGGGFGKFMADASRAAASEATGGLVSTEGASQVAAVAYKYLSDKNIGYHMMNKWFGGTVSNNLDLIGQRGLYDASVARTQEAAGNYIGNYSLMDAGMELIPNSFAVVSIYEYLNKDQLVEQIGAIMMAGAELSGNEIAIMSAKAAVTAMKVSMGEGYYVKTRTFLFQLNCDEQILGTIDTELWDKPLKWAEHKDKFEFNYIGTETAWAKVKAGIFTNKSEEELIRIATINAMDDVLAKLEKKYEIFKTKVPLMVEEVVDGKKTTQVLTANIGLKDGLSAGDKYEVLEGYYEEGSARTKYKKIGTVKVSKDQIWDNRYMADVENTLQGDAQGFTATRFDGGKAKFYSGCVLRQVK
ncbi:MAG: hypothetical protein SNH16_01105 [Rikenellaceae bacterium]